MGGARGCQQMARTYNMIKAVRTPKQKPRREEEKNKTVCTEVLVKDPGTVLTLREKGAAEIDPKPLYDDEVGNKIPFRTLEPEETELEEIPLVEGTEKMIKVGKTLSPIIKAELVSLMKGRPLSMVYSRYAWYRPYHHHSQAKCD